jgi:uncharacterized protein (TIGR02186 family)
MKTWLTALLAVLLPVPLSAEQPRLVPDVSEREVDIQYSFTGAKLLLFGAVIYPDGRPANSRVDIAVVLKGPPQSMVIREKQKVWGMWVNADSTRLASVPGFYSVASTRPVKAMLDGRTSAIYELGLDNIHLSPGEPDASLVRFEAGLRDLRQRQGLFASHPGTVEIVDGSLYRARLPIPARVPVGVYTAETFLIQNGRIIAAATRKIHIRKSGFEKFVADAAELNPISYGLVAILLSVMLGWLAGVLFKKD